MVSLRGPPSSSSAWARARARVQGRPRFEVSPPRAGAVLLAALLGVCKSPGPAARARGPSRLEGLTQPRPGIYGAPGLPTSPRPSRPLGRPLGWGLFSGRCSRWAITRCWFLYDEWDESEFAPGAMMLVCDPNFLDVGWMIAARSKPA